MFSSFEEHEKSISTALPLHDEGLYLLLRTNFCNVEIEASLDRALSTG